MPGGLLQLVATGAQNEIVNGNPQLTHFHTSFHRHTNFAMEHVRMPFSATELSLSATTSRMMSCRIDRYAQLLHDTYLYFTLPNIWSPLVAVVSPPTGYDSRTTAVGYEFQWVQNIGHVLIEKIDLVSNGQILQSIPGEWMTLNSHMTHDKNKRVVIDSLIGQDPALYDPANAYGRCGQYPHAIASLTTPTPVSVPNTTIPEPSIRSRQLVIPLPFWFCENPGLSLPLGALQNSEVYINVTFRRMTELYTIVDTVSSSATYGRRIRPAADDLVRFLSPPGVTGLPTNSLTNFFPDPYLDGNFIYLTEMEMNKFARADQSVLVKSVRYFPKEGQYGGNTELDMSLQNLVTRIVYLAQRSDMIATNEWSNYTNWADVNSAPFTALQNTSVPYLDSQQTQTFLYSSGQQQIQSVFPRDTIVDATLFLDGKERESTKPASFYNALQLYRHTTGATPTTLPGVYCYSFGLNHDQYQPSGALNGSQFNQITLRLSLLQPLPASQGTVVIPPAPICVLKSSVSSGIIIPIPPADIGLYDPNDILSFVPAPTGDHTYTYTYTVKAYVESTNILRIMSGMMNFVFAT